jgi:hypothetical protein
VARSGANDADDPVASIEATRRARRTLALLAFAVPNLLVAAIFVWWNVAHGGPGDWRLWERVVEGLPSVRFGATGEWQYIYSPAFAFLLAALVPLGFWGLTAIRFAAVLLLRDPWVIATVLASFAFWADTAWGNFFTFAFVTGALALGGSKWATLAYLVLFQLMPRPIEAPLALFLLIRYPWTRVPFVALLAAHAAFLIGGGWAGPWLRAASELADAHGAFFFNFGPTRVFGNAWYVVGVPLAAYLAYRGRPGLAGLAISPYLIPQYFLFALMPLARFSPVDHAPVDHAREAPA